MSWTPEMVYRAAYYARVHRDNTPDPIHALGRTWLVVGWNATHFFLVDDTGEMTVALEPQPEWFTRVECGEMPTAWAKALEDAAECVHPAEPTGYFGHH